MTLHLVSPPNDVWETSAEIPYWWRITTQIWVVTRHQYGISGLVSQTSFGRETSGSIAKCRLFSQAISVIELWIINCLVWIFSGSKLIIFYCWFFQICMNIASSTAMKVKKNVLYVDTGGSMSGTRIRDMLQGWNSSLEDQVYIKYGIL